MCLENIGFTPYLEKKMTKFQRHAGRIVCTLLCVLTLGAWADTRIIGGEETDAYPAVGIVGNVYTGGNSAGTLIESRKVLTSAHTLFREGLTPSLLDVPLLPREVWVDLNGTRHRVLAILVHPEFNPATLENDIAVLILPFHVTDVTPRDIRRTAPSIGQAITFVGFGSDGNDNGFGTKRVGTNTISEVTTEFVKWEYDGFGESNAVPGDSGAPVFVGSEVAAVHTASSTVDNGIGDISFNTRVDTYADWLDDPYDGDRVVIYTFRETLRQVGDTEAGVEVVWRRGFVAINHFDNEVWAAVATRQGPQGWSLSMENWGSDQAVATSVQGPRRPWSVLSTQQATTTGVGSAGDATNHFALRFAEGRQTGDFAAVTPVPRVMRGTTSLLSQADGSITQGPLTLRFRPLLSRNTANLSTEEVADNLLVLLEQQMAPLGIVEPEIDEIVPAVSSSDATVSSTINIHRVGGLHDHLGEGERNFYRVAGFLAYRGSSSDATLILFVLQGVQVVDVQMIDLFSDTDRQLNFLASRGGLAHLHILAALYQSSLEHILLQGYSINGRDVRRYSGLMRDVNERDRMLTNLQTRQSPRHMRTYANDSFSDTVNGLYNELASRYGYREE